VCSGQKQICPLCVPKIMLSADAGVRANDAVGLLASQQHPHDLDA
jgi:hypothetical protein